MTNKQPTLADLEEQYDIWATCPLDANDADLADFLHTAHGSGPFVVQPIWISPEETMLVASRRKLTKQQIVRWVRAWTTDQTKGDDQ